MYHLVRSVGRRAEARDRSEGSEWCRTITEVDRAVGQWGHCRQLLREAVEGARGAAAADPEVELARRAKVQVESWSTEVPAIARASVEAVIRKRLERSEASVDTDVEEALRSIADADSAVRRFLAFEGLPGETGREAVQEIVERFERLDRSLVSLRRRVRSIQAHRAG